MITDECYLYLQIVEITIQRLILTTLLLFFYIREFARFVILGVSLHDAYGFADSSATTNVDLEKYTSTLALIMYVLWKVDEKNGINYSLRASASTLNVTKEEKGNNVCRCGKTFKRINFRRFLF